MYDQILLPTDGEPPSWVAAEHALELAATYDATLHALYVLEANELPPDQHDPEAEADPEPSGTQAATEVATQAAEQDIESVRAIVRGSTVEAILDYTDEHDIDVIVMGTHGRSGIDRLMLGSIAEKVTRQSPVPVMTCRPTDD